MTTADPHAHLGYRPDIDGLRAVAVLAVVIYHAFPIWGGGGFIGVDIFFVISGFLISTIIFADVDAGRFSYVNFYDRRIRRIFPALLLVLATCLVFAAGVAFPSDASAIGKQLLGGAGFGANFLFWWQAGYFDGSSELKPLLHLWSLSVEEQYYIVWPVIVALLWKRRSSFLPALLLLLAASFIFNIACVATGHLDAAFYSPVSRAWELLIGSCLAAIAWRRKTSSAHGPLGLRPRIADAVGLAGALLIVVGLAVIRPTAAFPGWWALLPTVGAVGVIGAGPGAWVNRAVLSRSVPTFIGKISYPLYLWHWPLLAFPKLYDGGAGRTTRIAAVAGAFVLAWLTYRFVERPIRFGSRRATTSIALLGGSLVLACCAAALVETNGWLDRLPPAMRDISKAQNDFDYARYRQGTCFLNADQTPEAFSADCLGDTGGRRRLLLWGDSHAASLYPGMQAAAMGRKDVGIGQLTAAACPPVLGMSLRQRPHCQAINDTVWRRLAEHPPDTVVMAANWTFYNGENGWEQLDFAAIQGTARRLRQVGVRRVVLVGPFARWLMSEPVVLLREWRDDGRLPERSFNSFNRSSFVLDERMRQVAVGAGVEYLSPIAKLCDGDGCLQTVERDGRTYPIAWDDAHLTIEASELFVRQWFGRDLAPG